MALALRTAVSAQFYPVGSQVISCFPQLAVGGPDGARWTTSLTFVNPRESSSSSATQLASNPELDADDRGMLLGLLGGYDPYAAAGALGKLVMVTGMPVC